MSLTLADFQNWTPHPLTIYNHETGTRITLPPAWDGGIRLFARNNPVKIGTQAGFEVWDKPEMTELGTEVQMFQFMNARAVIVSTIVAEFCVKNNTREHVYAPSLLPQHTARDEHGRIAAIDALHRYT